MSLIDSLWHATLRNPPVEGKDQGAEALLGQRWFALPRWEGLPTSVSRKNRVETIGPPFGELRPTPRARTFRILEKEVGPSLPGLDILVSRYLRESSNQSRDHQWVEEPCSTVLTIAVRLFVGRTYKHRKASTLSLCVSESSYHCLVPRKIQTCAPSSCSSSSYSPSH